MNKDKRLLIKNGMLLTIAPFLPKVINILLLPIVTKYLTDVDFGIAATIAAYSQSIAAFSTLGLIVVIQNSFFKHPHHYKIVWRQVYGLLNIWMIIYAFLQAILLYFFIPEEAEQNKWMIIALTNFSTVFFGPTATIGNAYYIYTKQSFQVVWRSILASFITILSNYILIVHFKMGYMGWYVSSFIGVFFSNVTYWNVVNRKLKLRPIYKLKWRFIRQSLALSMPTIPHFYTPYLLDGAGRLALDQSKVPQSEIGRLSLSQQLGAVFETGQKGINDALTPFIMKAIKENNQQLIKKIIPVFVSLIFGLAFILSLWSKEIFKILLSNESLQSAYPYFILYIMSLGYRPMYLIASNYYFYFEKTKQLLLISFTSGIIATVIYFIFVPQFSIWAFLIGHFIACLYYGYSGYFYSGYTKNSTIRVPVFSIMALHLFLTVAAYYLVDYFIAKIVITILLGVIIFIYIKRNRNVFKK